MSRITDHVEYLSKKIGPRPAGTEEEQQAALYITEQFQKETGFISGIEDFSSSSNVEAGLAVLAGVAVVATLLAMIFPVLAIPAFLFAAAAAAAYSLEYFDRPVISRVLSRGASQNVVAKYQPGADEDPDQPEGRRRAARSRKIVLVAHYDTGRVTPPLVARIESLGFSVALAVIVAMIAVAFLLLIRIFIASSGGMGLLVLNVLSAIAAVVCLYPIMKAVLMRSAPYNEGAINNASGTAALIEVARRIARGSVSEHELVELAGDSVTVHGEAAAREAGLVPEGARIRYEAEAIAPPDELIDHSEEERLLSAKAAIAALTGQPVERRVYGSVAGNLVNSHAGGEPEPEPEFAEAASAAGAWPSGAGAAPQPAPAPEPVGDADGFENAPSWFVAAQQNAKRSERFNVDAAPEVKRSKYTEAIENAERERAEIEEEARAAEQRTREEEARAALAASERAPEPEPVEEPEPAPEAVEPAPEPAAPETGKTAPGASAAEPAPDQQDQGPDGTVAMKAPVPSAEILAEAAGEGEAAPAGRNRMAGLPTIEEPEPAQVEPTTNPSRSGILRSLRANIPSLSGLIDPVRSGDKKAKASSAPARRAGAQQAPAAQQPQPQVAPVPEPTPQAQATPQAQSAPAPQPAPEPVSQPEAVPAPAPEAPEPDLVSLDAPASGAAAPSDFAPRSVEVPRSRSGNLLNRLRKNDPEALADTPQQWLDVDEDFEARDVGRERGSWKSFRDEQYFDEDDDFGDFASGDDAARSGRRWQGGAATNRIQLGYADTRSDDEAYLDPGESGAIPAEPEAQELSEEIEQIYHFRNPLFDTDIWFVAMGADGESHDGARAFLEEHRDELRGAMIVEIESLGVGELAVASEEGRVRKVQASSRVKRYTRNATAATGITPDTVSLAGTDSISSTLQKAGFQAMHLFGAEEGRPALKGSPDDVLENVDEMLLDEHVNYVFELLKSR